jgi:altronate dehydratase large subunit
MAETSRAVVVDERDSVATTLADLAVGEVLMLRVGGEDRRILLRAAVARLEQQAQVHGARLNALGADHLAAGITTNEEKALGSIQKAGHATLQQVIGYAERPTRKGLVFMGAVGGGVPEITGLAAAGAQAILFVTGSGHPTGHPVAPTLKVTANPRTATRFASSIDVDVSPALTGEIWLDDAPERVREALLAVCAGQMTRNELLGVVESTVASVHA